MNDRFFIDLAKIKIRPIWKFRQKKSARMLHSFFVSKTYFLSRV